MLCCGFEVLSVVIVSLLSVQYNCLQERHCVNTENVYLKHIILPL